MNSRLLRIGFLMIRMILVVLIGFGVFQTPSVAEALPPQATDLTLQDRFSTVKAPTAPVLSVEPTGCAVILRITDAPQDWGGFLVYRLDATAANFQRVATLGAGNGESLEYTDAGLAGHVEYFVSAFNAAGETPSNLAAADLEDSACQAPGWSELKIEKADLTVTQPVEKLYCNYAIDDSQWVRLPSSANDFIFPQDGVFDLAPAFGSVPLNTSTGDLRLAVNCWGSSGGNLMDLGTASKTFSTAEPGRSFALHGSQFELVTSAVFVPKLMFIKTPLIRPPFNFRSTTSLAECKARSVVGEELAKVICESSFATGATVLVWDWIPTCIFPVEGSTTKCSEYITETDGYRIYKTIGTTTTLFRTIKDRNLKMFVFPAGTLDGPPASYTVVAFRLDDDSFDSNPYVFTGPGTATKTVILKDPLITEEDHFAEKHNEYWACELGRSHWPGTGDESLELLSRVKVGFGQFYTEGSSPFYCWDFVQSWSRGRVRFDTTGVTGPVFKAQLKFQALPDYLSVRGAFIGFLSCADMLNFSTGPSTFEPYDLLPSSVTTFNVDVTDAVKRWVEKGEPNFGFMLQEHKHGLHNSDVCWSTYEKFELIVTSFVSP